jgi:hypothetical protein
LLVSKSSRAARTLPDAAIFARVSVAKASGERKVPPKTMSAILGSGSTLSQANNPMPTAQNRSSRHSAECPAMNEHESTDPRLPIGLFIWFNVHSFIVFRPRSDVSFLHGVRFPDPPNWTICTRM